MRLLVYGSRDWTDREAIHRDLDAVFAELTDIDDTEPLIVVNGFAPGADRMADEWASAHERAGPWRFPARWQVCEHSHPSVPCPPGFDHRKRNRHGDDYCPLAGFRRNQEMIDRAEPQQAYGYTLGTRGAADMTGRVLRARVPLRLLDRS